VVTWSGTAKLFVDQQLPYLLEELLKRSFLGSLYFECTGMLQGRTLPAAGKVLSNEDTE